MPTIKTPLPADEPDRLAALSQLNLDAGWADPAFEGLARLAARVANAEMGFFAVVEADHCRYESVVGMTAKTLPREGSPCGWAVAGRSLVEVADVQADERFAHGAWATAATTIRHYAATVVRSPEGHAIGTLGVMDTRPRQLEAAALRGLEDLAQQAAALLQLRAVQPVLRDNRKQIRQLTKTLDRAGRALQESRRQFQTLADHAPVLIWMASESGERTNFNRTWMEFTGRQLDQDRGFGWVDIVHEADRPQVLELYRGACQRREAFHQEYRLLRGDGVFRWVLDHGVPLYSGRDRYLGFIGSCIDLTEQKEFTAQLAQAEERLRLALEGGKVGLWDWDQRTNDVYYSPTYKEQLGFPPDTPWNNFEAWRSRVHPDDIELALRTIRDYTNGLTAVYQTLFRLQHADGSWRWIRSEGQLLRDESGQPRRMVGVHVDITDQKEIEQRLRQSEQRLELAIQGTRDGIWDWDVGQPRIWSAPRFKQLLGYREGEVPDTLEWFLEQVHPDDQSRVREAIRRHVDESAPYDVEHRLKTKTGRFRWYRSRARSVRDPVTGRSLRMSGSLEDIHERRRDQQRLEHYSAELERSNAELENFAYVASHDLKAPLHGIETLAGFLKEDCWPQLPEASRGHLDKLLVRTHRMRQLLDDLLAYSRVGRMEGTAQTIHAGQLVAEVLETADAPSAFVLRQSGPDLTLESPVAPLRQVILNLVTNAIKHHDAPDGTVEVTIRDLGDWVEFAVRDNGPGIESRFHDRIFRMFQTLTTNPDQRGSGMGLAIVKRAVENRGGVLQLESTPGVGSTFTFTWPKSPPRAADDA